MQHFTVQVTPQTEYSQIIENLKRKIGSQISNNTQDAMVFDQALFCIGEFSERAKEGLRNGTILQISKQFEMSFVSFSVRLNCPCKTSLIATAIYKFRGNI